MSESMIIGPPHSLFSLLVANQTGANKCHNLQNFLQGAIHSSLHFGAQARGGLAQIPGALLTSLGFQAALLGNRKVATAQQPPSSLDDLYRSRRTTRENPQSEQVGQAPWATDRAHRR